MILTRSNFGLELAVGNNNAASGGVAKAAEIRPFESESAARLAANLGEVGFMRHMQEQAIAWIKEDPLRFVRLSTTRGVLILLPSERMIGWQPLIPVAVAWAGFLLYGAAKIAATRLMLLRGPARMLWLNYTMLPLAPYLLTHVNTRYTFIVFFPTVCLLGLAASRLTRSRQTKATPAAKPLESAKTPH